MSRLLQLWRLLHIYFVLIKYGLDKWILSFPVFASLRFLAHVNPRNWRWIQPRSRGESIRCALEELGPIFVKFGQTLSTRRDLLPDDIAEELAKLQDQVPPFDGALEIIEQIYGCSVTEIFQTFDTAPLASASIAQVHAATLFNGKQVVVKILRPEIRKIIRRDVALLYSVAGFIERYWSEGPRLHPREVVAEFERIIFDELDLLKEAANASLLRRNFSHSPLLYVPEVNWQHTRDRVLVIERISGIPIANIVQLKAANINLKKLAERGVEIFFTQVFRDCFFHADMHPGNIFVAATNPAEPQYIAVDFGIMGTLTSADQRYLAENLLAFFKRDYRRVAELHIESGWVPSGTRIDEFESAIRTVCEPIFERPLKDISFGQMLLRLFQTGKRFNMEVQPQLILLQKTLLNIEGLGRQIYPDLDLWNTAKPFLERWLRQQIGPRAFIRKVRENAPYWSEKLPELPGLIYETLVQLRKNTGNPGSNVVAMARQTQQVRRAKRRGFFWGVFSALLMGVVCYVVWIWVGFVEYSSF